MTQEQEEFEKFVRRTNGKWADKCLTRGPDGRYNVIQTWNDWIAWQACWSVCEALRIQPQAPVAEVPNISDLAEAFHREVDDSEFSDKDWLRIGDGIKAIHALLSRTGGR